VASLVASGLLFDVIYR